ncbi:membrane protein [Orientia tsutsugamushi str. Gilliam]|uniref:Membrane protein n=2 Tax=Orientia tsutsugamushi str. Gilliam TaxID=1359184 RepID=A0A2U3RIM8_ORITS|nr:membrane protein [Orientia tsutsugamushi str. Gilliam]
MPLFIYFFLYSFHIGILCTYFLRSCYNVKFNTSKVSIDTSQFYIKFSTGIATNYDTLEAGIGYRLDRHRMDVRLGFMCHHNCRDNFVQGNYYYNIIEGNKASIVVTGGLVSAFNGDSDTGIDLGVGTAINLSRDTYLDIECSTIANYRPLPIHIRFGLRVHI